MYGFRRFGIKLGLSTIKRILAGLGNPQDTFACIHVAGTNGKGSVASSLASILHRNGYKTGLYMSPHLVRFNERIQVNNRPVTNEKVVTSYSAVKDAHFGKRDPTFFEFTTAMALFEFAAQKVDWAVIETGMGGRLDATNIINPALSIITNISLEHRAYLGNTLAQIAGEKAGIIKKHTPLVTGVRQKKAFAEIKRIAAGKEAPLFRLGTDFKVRRNQGQTFSYYGIRNVWHNLQTALPGSYQVDNAALVLAACELIGKNNATITRNNIQEGLSKNHWPGRLEIVSNNPFIILDGAHNLAAARNLAKFLSTNLAGKAITLVVGILDDKPYKAMLKSLLTPVHRVILTRAKIDRALEPERLYDVAQNLNADAVIIPDVEQAIKKAVETTPRHGAICIAGSLYVVGEAKEAFEKGLISGCHKSG
ncbi:MAG: bifunctional folylpolyglutamate synthase/dihydrofolate synthase [Deltaproteobacteria bacterium]|jgi:dihydrofolate synthase/folylpolyglutamate synthase|nr:bifunctional folylpolyglutamate synthase/dihydrofolate synthase [Deltaproteobacteria bacterium]